MTLGLGAPPALCSESWGAVLDRFPPTSCSSPVGLKPAQPGGLGCSHLYQLLPAAASPLPAARKRSSPRPHRQKLAPRGGPWPGRGTAGWMRWEPARPAWQPWLFKCPPAVMFQHQSQAAPRQAFRRHKAASCTAHGPISHRGPWGGGGGAPGLGTADTGHVLELVMLCPGLGTTFLNPKAFSRPAQPSLLCPPPRGSSCHARPLTGGSCPAGELLSGGADGAQLGWRPGCCRELGTSFHCNLDLN